MSMFKTAMLSLKCVVCGHREKRDAEKCRGDDNPICPKCYGPMMLEQAKVKS